MTQYILNGETVPEKERLEGRFIPIIPVYGDEVIVEGERKLISLTRFAKDAARMYNYWRTASTELVALAPKAPFIGPKGAFRAMPRSGLVRTPRPILTSNMTGRPSAASRL